MSHEYRDDLEGWTQQWEKALEDGIFPKQEEFIPSKQTAVSSFFGASDTDPSGEASDADATYWGMVHQRAEYPAQLAHSSTEEVLNEAKRDVREIEKRVAASPNPIRQATTGKDQDSSEKSLGKTFEPVDLDKLAELKKKLYDLESKLAESPSLPNKSLIAKIEDLSKQIDDFSDSLGQGDEMSQQGD